MIKNRKNTIAYILLIIIILLSFSFLVISAILRMMSHSDNSISLLSKIQSDSLLNMQKEIIYPNTKFLQADIQTDSAKYFPFFSVGKSVWNYIGPFGINMISNIVTRDAAEQNNFNLEISAYIYQGIVNYQYRNLPDSIDNNYLKKALNLSKNSKNRYGIIISSCNLAKNFQIKNNADSVNYYMNLALRNLIFSDKSNNSSNNLFVAYYYNTKAFLFESSMRFDSSIVYSNIALEYLEKNVNYDILSYSYTNLAENYNLLNKYRESIKYSLLGLEAAKLSNNYENILKCNEQLAIAYEKLGETAKALESIKIAKIMNDGILINLLNSFKNSFDLDSDQRIDSLLIIYLMFLVILLCIILGIIISIFIYQRITRKNRFIKKLNEDKNRLSKFFKIISHDLKTPLYSFNTLAKLLSSYYDNLSDKEIIEYINNLRDSSDNVLLLLNNLLTWTELQKDSICVRPDKFNLLNLVEKEAKIQHQFAIIKDITINVEIDPNVIVYLDYDMFCIVIRNLLSNAIKFTPKGGNIKIISEENDFSIAVVIMDNGIGIDESDKSKLFNIEAKYSTLGTFNEKGTGLGLCLCKELVELNKGILSFTSVYGEGSSFKVILPKN